MGDAETSENTINEGFTIMFYMFMIHKVDNEVNKVRVSQIKELDHDEEWFKEYLPRYESQKINLMLAEDPENHPGLEQRITVVSNNEYIKEFQTTLIDILLMLGEQLNLEIVK